MADPKRVAKIKRDHAAQRCATALRELAIMAERRSCEVETCVPDAKELGSHFSNAIGMIQDYAAAYAVAAQLGVEE